jgi:mercuric ion binding protein
MKFERILLALAGLAFSLAAAAAQRTVTLEVPGMYCETCPITVSKALRKVGGVKQVKTSLEKKQAVVTFDDAKTSVEALEQATANAGYPSKPTR